MGQRGLACLGAGGGGVVVPMVPGLLEGLSHPWGSPEADGGKDKDACGVSWQIAEVGGTLDQPGNVGPGRGMYSPE